MTVLTSIMKSRVNLNSKDWFRSIYIDYSIKYNNTHKQSHGLQSHTDSYDREQWYLWGLSSYMHQGKHCLHMGCMLVGACFPA